GLGCRDRAVMGVMKEQAIARAVPAVLGQATDEGGIGPLVDQQQIDVVERSVEINVGGLIKMAAQHRVRLAEGEKRVLADIKAQIAQAPAVAWLENMQRVSALQQLACHAAQEMRVAVVPVRYERMAEQDDAHLRRHPPMRP